MFVPTATRSGLIEKSTFGPFAEKPASLAGSVHAADQKIITPVAALMLFVFSALVTGGLILGKPLMLYFDGHKKEGVKLLFFTGTGLFVFMALVFAVLLIMK